MAKLVSKVLLGFEDEVITEKYKSLVDYTTNKIGGKPDWPNDVSLSVTCKLCGLDVPLILQIYAPLDNSLHHRTLYIFACISPNCWNQQGSWICIRVQVPDISESNRRENSLEDVRENQGSTEWCSGAETWGEDEENGNTVIEDSLPRGTWGTSSLLRSEMSGLRLDEDEDRNANGGAGGGAGRWVGGGGAGATPPPEGASGTGTPRATAIIEGEEGEVVCIDTPTRPQINLVALLEEAAPLPEVPRSSLEFLSSFINVFEEDTFLFGAIGGSGAEVGREDWGSTLVAMGSDEENCGGEGYEKSLPPHGDRLIHSLLRRISLAPGQLLRYGGKPYPLSPLPQSSPPCQSCSRPTRPELQILPTMIPKLKLIGSSEQVHLEFGTVILYSCSASCWDLMNTTANFREELLLVQSEKV